MIIRLLVIIFVTVYFVSMITLAVFTVSLEENGDDNNNSFLYYFYLVTDDEGETMRVNDGPHLIIFYFIMTTLTRVGFGDYTPVSEIERVYVTFLLLCGVPCFGYFVGHFIYLLDSLRKLDQEDYEDSKQLH